jgi:hypothetical protein
MNEEKETHQVGERMDEAEGGFILLAGDLSPINAQILLGRLHAEGVDAHLSGAEVVQNNLYWRSAFRGVQIFVRASQKVEASHIMATVSNGDYDLDAPEAETDSRPSNIRAKRLFGWSVVFILAIVFGGIALAAIWSPSYDYFPYSTTPEPTAHIVGKWVLSALVLAPVVFWLFFIEASIKRKTKR